MLVACVGAAALCVWSLYLVVFFFFFFQAEDGIRDKLVTGVQTCALPICEVPALCDGSGSHDRRLVVRQSFAQELRSASGHRVGPVLERQNVDSRRFWHRSEERRVGEEGRSRWAADHLKKKKKKKRGNVLV